MQDIYSVLIFKHLTSVWWRIANKTVH